MAIGQVWVKEVGLRIADHSNLFHDAARTQVGWDRERDEAGKVENLEGIACDGARTFGGESLSPGGMGEPPADLDDLRRVGLGLGRGRKQKGGIEARDGEANIANESASRAKLSGEETEAVLVEMGFDAVGEGVGLSGGEGRGEVLHHARVGVDGAEGLAVSGSPGPEDKARGGEEVGHGRSEWWLMGLGRLAF
jgi:hypothetical protein